MAKVGIVMGSDSDMPIMSQAAAVLEQFGIDFEMTIISAHREPDIFFEWAKGAEERGQARAIAQNLYEFSKLKTPVICIILSEGGSGGALALTVSDYIYMFENAVYSVLSPEGFTSILFKDKVPVSEVAEVMKLTSRDLMNYGIADEIIEEPLGGIRYVSDKFSEELKERLIAKFNELLAKDTDELLENRYQKFRKIGSVL